MFILYIISEILNAKIFDELKGNNQTILANIIMIFVPAILIVILLLKGTAYAKKASGEFTEKIISGTKAVAGLAVGAAVGGAALLGTGVVGGLASKAATSKAVTSNLDDKGWKGRMARTTLRTADYGTRASFDVRKIPGMGALTKAAGMNLEAAKAVGLGSKEGGYEQRKEDKENKRQKRAKRLEVREDEELKQNLNKVEADLQGLLNANAKELGELDKLITKKREALNDTTAMYGGNSPEAKRAGLELQNIKNRRKALKDAARYSGDQVLDASGNIVAGTENAQDYTDRHAGAHVYKDADGVTHTKKRSMNYMEDTEVRDRKQDIVDENRSRKRTYADNIEKKWFWGRTNRAAAHKIRMETKIEDKGGGH